MIRKSLGFLLVGFIFVLLVTVKHLLPERRRRKIFSFFFDGDGSYLGVQTEEVTKDNFAKYGLREVRGVASKR
jgi:hypothetical protein